MKRTALKPGKPLARTAGLKRSAPLRPKSLAAARQGQALKRAYAAAPDAKQCWCSVCGQVGKTEHMHLYTQRQRPDLRCDPLNWLVVGKYCGCHRLQEHNKPEFARQYPEVWATILRQMQALDPVAFVAFRQKNPF